MKQNERSFLETTWGVLRWRRYAQDPELFFRECLWLPTAEGGGGRVPFELFDYQRDDLQVIQNERYVAILKARQLGLTFLLMGYAYWNLMFKPGANIVLISKDRETSEAALEKSVDFFWRWMPRWTHAHRPEIETDSAKEHVYRFRDGMSSRIVSRAPTPTAGAGDTYTLALWDEAALPDVTKPGIGDSIFSSLEPTTLAGGQLIVFSTARGGHNRFARLYRRAAAGVSEFTAIFHPWWVSRFMNPLAERVGTCPDGPCEKCVDDRIRESKKREHVEAPWLFHSEFPATEEEAFTQSGRSRFGGLPPIERFSDLPFRGYLTRNALGEIEPVADEDGPIRLSRELLDRGGPPRWATSALSYDPASGQGMDYTAMIGGWVAQDGVPEIHAYFHSNTHENAEAARQADLLGRYLEDERGGAALLAVEDQGGHGQTPLYVLTTELNYPNLYVHRYTGHRKYKREVRYGMPMTDQRRPLVVDALARWLRYDIDDLDTLRGIFPLLRHELGAFVVGDNGVPRADTGMNDDLVMAAAIWVYILMEEVGAPGVTPEPRVEKRDPNILQLPDLFKPAQPGPSQRQKDRMFARKLTTGQR